MKKTLIILTLLFAVFALRAETLTDRVVARNELRIGWGDQLFESLIWHDPASIVSSMPADYSAVYHEDYQYLQHVFAEYQYRFNHWFSFGIMVDGSAVKWNDVTRNGSGAEVDRSPGHYFVNAALMPTVRATYFSRQHFNLYSGLGFGLLINTGSEIDQYGRYTVAAPVLNIALLGASVNWGKFFMAAEFGGMYSLLDSDTIFLAKSRMFTASLGVHF